MPPLSSTTTKAAASTRPDFFEFAGGADISLSPPDVLRRKPSAGILTTSTTAAGKRTARITTTATACPAAATATTTPHASRHPLRLRDQNATSALRTVKPGTSTPKSPPVTAPRMPSYERPSAGQRQPTVARAVNKPPVTPKIAARTPAPQQQAPTLATPLPRRTTAESTLSINGNGSRDRDELASPVSAFLNTNITPRSGARQTRVNSANSTPNGTPNPDRHDPWETRSGLGLPGTDDAPRRPVVTFSPPSEVGSGSRQDRDSKFFYASDAAKPTPQPATTRPSALQQPKPATFFYANANNAPERQGGLPRPFSPPLPSPSSQESLMSKFIYANGAPELQPPAKIGPTLQKSSGSVVSTASRVPTSRHGNPPRATSPIKPSHITPKNNTPAILSPRSPVSAVSSQVGSQLGLGRVNVEPSARPKSHARTKSGAVIEPPVATRRVSAHSSLPPSGATSPSNPPTSVLTDPPIATRRVSAQSSRPPSGSTSPSNPPNPGSVELPIATRRVSAQSSVPSSGATSPCNPQHPGLTLPSNPATTGFASLLQAAEDFAEPEDAQSEPLESPTKTSQDGQVTELVANARRERRVQDLEIRNGSLEAINRTLERQLRKQTAELRRYQRLSRSGRLSLGGMGSRIPSASTVDGGALAGAGMDLNDLSEEDSEIEAEDAELDELEDELEDEDDLSGSEGSVERSPSATALRQEKERRDERRLQLDLSKHQQLLVDSQKINQSLKRCLGWTEELIKEGKRALEYQVRPGDVELGGRVLAPEEVERRERAGEGAEEDTTLGEDAIYAIDALGRDSLADVEVDGDADADATTTKPTTTTTTTWSKDTQDRDSGIELPADGG